MKQLLSFVAVAMIALSVSLAQAGTIEDKITFGNKTSHALSLFENEKVESGTIGWSAYFLAGQYWSEGYVGPTWSPAPWICLSASIGLQSAESNPIRYASDVWIGNALGSAYAVYERGAKASDNWWKVKPLLNIGHDIKVGAILEKDKDVAPTAEIGLAKSGLSVWGAYYKEGSQLGLKYSF